MIAVLALCAVLLPSLASAGPFEDAMAAGDLAWRLRAEDHVGADAASGPIEQAVAAYRRAVELDPRRLDGHLALLQALWFRAEYARRDPAEIERAFTDGRIAHARALEVLSARVGGPQALFAMSPHEVGRRFRGDEQAAGVFFWGAVHWGLWAEVYGHVRAGRGAGDRLYFFSNALMAIDASYDGGRGYQVLGRVHARAPRVPFVTGWVDRRIALQALARAVELNPDDRFSRFFLAEALLMHAPSRRGEAVELLRSLAGEPTRDATIVEDLASQRDARALLARLGEPESASAGRTP